jgi:hypothetical protein
MHVRMYICRPGGAIGPESPLLGHRTCWAREVGTYLHTIYRNAIGYKGLVIRNAKLVFTSASSFCKHVSRTHSIQHIIGTNGAFYRACYPSAGWQGAAGISQPLMKPDVRRAEISLCMWQLKTAAVVVMARWRAYQRPSSSQEQVKEKERDWTKEISRR